jgi:hypothetical protein
VATVGGGGAGRCTVSWLTEQAVAMPTIIMVTMGRLFIDNSLCGEVNGRKVWRLHRD